jgi:hypothetical protein
MGNIPLRWKDMCMLTYENLVSVLLGSIERTGLNVAYTQELLDTHALGRSLSITCLPDGVEDDRSPIEPPLRAVVSFRWSPEFTVFSLRGGDSLDNIERIVDERLYAQAQSGPSLDIEVTYYVPLNSDQQRDLAALPGLARTLQDLHASLAEPEDLVRIDTLVAFSAGRTPRVQSVTARRVWSLDEALYDGDLLSDTFDELCAELHTMLEALAGYYANLNGDEAGSNAAEASYGDRRYLKPPTA